MIFIVDEPYFSKINKYSFRGAQPSYDATLYGIHKGVDQVYGLESLFFIPFKGFSFLGLREKPKTPTLEMIKNQGKCGRFDGERGNYLIRVYLLFIQHKRLKVVCNPKAILFSYLISELVLKTPN
jgi:hypothetical protein